MNGVLVKVNEWIECNSIKTGIELPQTRVQEDTFLSLTGKELGFREVKWLNEGHSVRGDSRTRHLIYLTPTSRCLPLPAHLLALCLCRGQAEVGTGEDLGFPEYRNCGYITLIVYRHILI